jgi:hypothetical protein
MFARLARFGPIVSDEAVDAEFSRAKTLEVLGIGRIEKTRNSLSAASQVRFGLSADMTIRP